MPKILRRWQLESLLRGQNTWEILISNWRWRRTLICWSKCSRETYFQIHRYQIWVYLDPWRAICITSEYNNIEKISWIYIEHLIFCNEELFDNFDISKTGGLLDILEKPLEAPPLPKGLYKRRPLIASPTTPPTSPVFLFRTAVQIQHSASKY